MCLLAWQKSNPHSCALMSWPCPGFLAVQRAKLSQGPTSSKGRLLADEVIGMQSLLTQRQREPARSRLPVWPLEHRQIAMASPGLPTTWMDHPCSDHMTVPITKMKKMEHGAGECQGVTKRKHIHAQLPCLTVSGSVGSECSFGL